MDHDDCVSGGWDSLGSDLQRLVLTKLSQRFDQCSLQAVMQTSRDLRLLASSFVSGIEIGDASALAHYPRHAGIKRMNLCMQPFTDEAHMEPSCMVTWLQSTAACNRLAAVTSVSVELPGRLQAMDAATMNKLLVRIGIACPNLRSLRIEGFMREEEDVIRAMFAAIGQHLPGIIKLQLDWGNSLQGNEYYKVDMPIHHDLHIAGIDWAACLPRGLQKFTGDISLHHELLQQLVLMPSLTEVEVYSLSIAEGEELLEEVQSEVCAWRSLRISSSDSPSCQEFGRFTAAMPLLAIYMRKLEWSFRAAEGPILAKAASWLSQIHNCPKELKLELNSAATASTAGLISSLAPLSGSLVSLELRRWPVTRRTIDELAAALPSVHKLTLWSCSLSSCAWDRMSSLTSVTDLAICQTVGSRSIPLAQIIAFTSAISHPMALTFRGGAVSIDDQAGWQAFEGQQRRNNGSRQITVIFKPR